MSMAPAIPDLLDAGSSAEFCTRMSFKITPTYSSKLHARMKWHAVIKEAQQQLGWDKDFSQNDLSTLKLSQLASLIDKTFLNGSFIRTCQPKFVVKDKLSGGVPGLSETAVLNAVAGFEPDSNSLIFFKKGWRRQPSLRSPVQADGVYCLSKLEWLCHAMGHEMVHCIVHNACPVSREYDAYKMDNGHGPIFMRLNRHIFGHSSMQYKSGWSRLTNLQVQWDASSSISAGASSSSSSEAGDS